MFGFLKHKTNKATISVDESKVLTRPELVEAYKADIEKIAIDNQPFRLSGMLHILTNRVSELLQSNNQVIYYDVESDVGRYIVGDNDYIEQVLEILLKDALLLNVNHEVILKISKIENKFLVFEVSNKKGLMKKDLYKQYIDSEQILQSLSPNINDFVKAKKIVEAMKGSLELKSGRISGTQYAFQIPYYKDEDYKSNQDTLKTFLNGRNALFIGKSKHDTKRTQYIFETYGIHIHHMQLDDFENKKPNLAQYDMAIMRSEDLSYKHVSFFKNIYQDETSQFKNIIIHEVFENEEKVTLSKSIAHAELNKPIIIGDVEEILYQMYMMQKDAVKEINSIAIFDPESFRIKGGNTKLKEDDLDWFKGANIAIVEDSKVDHRVIENILSMKGVNLFSLKNGAEMIELLQTVEIDIIFTDINMPIMDGLIMTKFIRREKKWDHIPIISISSMSFSHEIEKMKAAGMNAAISKPIKAKEVYGALENFLVMTAKIRNREVPDDKVKTSLNMKVLDIDKGVKKAGGEKQYQEALRKTMKTLKGTREAFEKMISDERYVALEKYVNSALFMYEGIHAPEMIKMMKELNEFISKGQKIYLGDYVYLYEKNWKKLEKEVEKYIKNSR